MTWTLADSGTYTGIIGTENTVDTLTTNGTYVLQLDLSNYVLGDIVEFRIYTLVLSGGSYQLTWKMSVGPVPPLIIAPQSPPVAVDQGIRYTIKPIAGTARATPFKMMRV